MERPMNWRQLESNWDEVQDRVQQKWTRLTESDLDSIGGRRSELVSKIQKHYSMNKTDAESEAESFVKEIH
jgi:uncharacterized protein YjbJ (UPF0337 family)